MVPGTRKARLRPPAAPVFVPPVEAQASVVARMGAPFMYAFLFFAYSRILDFTVPQLHLPMLVGSVAVLAAILSGGIQRVLSSSIGILLGGFTAWLVLAIPLSYWKGGSFQLVMETWTKSALVFLMIVGLAETLKQCRFAMYAVGFAAVTIASACFYFRAFSAFERLALPSGVLRNPNDLAMILLICLPFWLLFAMQPGRGPFRRVLAGVWVFPILYIVLHTGSRTALISLAVVGLVIFRHVSLAYKALLLVAVAGFGAAAIALVPDTVLARYTVIVADRGQVYSPHALEAAASSEQRIGLFKESLRLTLEHPVFGVGPGQFQSYSAFQAGEQGKPAAWRETHCTYTEVSSEAGVPAFLLYTGALLLCLKKIYALYRMTKSDPRLETISRMSYCLLLSLVSFSVSAVFVSAAYDMFFPTLAGLTVAVERCAGAEMKQLELAAQSPAGA